MNTNEKTPAIKKWFKHKSGYLNIDSENIYFTESGNWAEARELQEKTKTQNRKNNMKNTYVGGFMFILIFGAILKFIDASLSDFLVYLLFPISIVAVPELYRYLNPRMQPTFKIPFPKIKDIKSSGSSLEIIFTNAMEQEDYRIIKGLNQIAIDTMEELKLDLNLTLVSKT